MFLVEALLISLLWVFICRALWRQESAHGHYNSGENCHSTEQNTNDEARSSNENVSSGSTCLPISTELSKDKAQARSRYWAKLKFSGDVTVTDGIIALFTALMFVVAIGQCNISSKQNALVEGANKIAGDAADSAEVAAVAAKEAVELADKTAKLQLRAYVDIADVRIEYDYDKGTGMAVVEIKNSGQTPAKSVTLTSYESYGKRTPFDKPAVQRKLKKTANTPSIAAGGQPKLYRVIDSKLNRKELEGGEYLFNVFGEIDYRDEFGGTYKDTFNYYIGNDVGLGIDGNRMAGAPVGNDER